MDSQVVNTLKKKSINIYFQHICLSINMNYNVLVIYFFLCVCVHTRMRACVHACVHACVRGVCVCKKCIF